VFGSINLDLIGTVERLPRPGETVPGGVFQSAPGGKGANQALAARRAGARVRLVGAVGRDSFSEPALALLKSGSVDLSKVGATDSPTGVALILVGPGGENMIAVLPGANGAIGPAEAKALNLTRDDVLVLQLEIPVHAMTIASEDARRVGARVLLNFAPFRRDAIPLARIATHLIVNETECAALTEAFRIEAASSEEKARALETELGATVIVTLGKDGVIAIEGETAWRVPALRVEAIDSVGAGDAFCGYLAAALSEALPLDDALRLAAVAGSLACTKSGAQPAMPARREVEVALRTLSGTC
jgi:ribokinase